MDEAAYEAGYREGAGLCIAALAMASTFKVSGDFRNADYVRTAEEAFAYLEKNNRLFANDGKENIIDDYCALLAAVELFRATGKPVYGIAAERRARSLQARLTTSATAANYWRADDGDRPFFHPVDAGLPVLSLLKYAEIAEGEERTRALDAVRKSLEFELAMTAKWPIPSGTAGSSSRTRRAPAGRAFSSRTTPKPSLGGRARMLVWAPWRPRPGWPPSFRTDADFKKARGLQPGPAELDPGAKSL